MQSNMWIIVTERKVIAENFQNLYETLNLQIQQAQ